MFFNGISVAKQRHTALVLDEAGRMAHPAFSVENRRVSFDELAATLAALAEPVIIGLEAIGRYWLALYDDPSQRGYVVTVINPLQVAAYRRSGVRKVKTDRTRHLLDRRLSVGCCAGPHDAGYPPSAPHARVDPLPILAHRTDRGL